MNFGKMEEEYFCAEGWTGVIGLKWLTKISVLAQPDFDIIHSPIDCYGIRECAVGTSPLIVELRHKLARLSNSETSYAVLPFGIDVIDQRLPNRSLALRAVHEIFEYRTDSLRATLSAMFAGRSDQRKRSPDSYLPTLAKIPSIFLVGSQNVSSKV
jgi:hypothetical protein